MYSLNDFLHTVMQMPSEQIASPELYCTEINPEATFYTNEMQDTLACYTFTLVRCGWLTIVYNGQELTLTRGDLYIYSPGMSILVVSASQDYRGICLMADESITLETTAVRDAMRMAYFPLVELQEPKLSLADEQMRHLQDHMLHIIEGLHTPHLYKAETLRLHYALFLLDLLDIQEHSITQHHFSKRTTDLFFHFIYLLPRHFAEHHDIGFYAQQLHVTTTHLSRIVRQVAGRTVIDYINQMLLTEATWLLQSSNLSIAAIADRLHFADQASFSKFFTRLKGVSPRDYKRMT